MVLDKQFIEDYLERYKKSLFETDVSDQLIGLKSIILDVKSQNGKLIIAGNGGSAALASHVSVDFTKQGGVQAINFNEADLITCFVNDYGAENWIAKAIEFYSKKEDLAILVSSSGRSKNLVNAAKVSKQLGLKVVTLTGFDPDNPLRQIGDLNFWVDSVAYNIVENTHLIWLLLVCDMIIGKAEYSS
jgi:D-sedoheptulose 7-phosphate isomerase